MSYVPINEPAFRATLLAWFQEQGEILVLIRFSHAAGSKDFEFFSSFEDLLHRINALPPLACVTAFKTPQLPLRGRVDDDFVAKCLALIPDGSEYLVVETERRIGGRVSWFHHRSGQSHEELHDDLADSYGAAVATGLYPPWLADTDEVISAVVPDAGGITGSGVY